MTDVPEWSVKRGPFVFRGQFRLPVINEDGKIATKKQWVVAFLDTRPGSRRRAPTLLGHFLDEGDFFEWPAGTRMIDEAGAREALPSAYDEMRELVLASCVIES